MKAIIAAGGSGTRLRPLTFSSNKHLLPIANKPLLLYPFEAIVATGIKKIGVVVNETRAAIEGLLGDGSRWGVKISYIPQEKPLGLAHVVKISQDFIDSEPFVFHLGDNIFTEGIMRPFKAFVAKKPDALLTMIQHEENYRLGVPYFDNRGQLIKVVEKPENPPNKFGIPGLYFFNQHVFEAFKGPDQIRPSARGELEITELYSFMIDQGYRVEAEEIDGRWMDPGKFTDMLEANRYLLETKLEPGGEGEADRDSTIRGQIYLGKGTRVVNSQLEGPVSIAENCLIENARIGPNVAIDTGTKVEDTTIKNAIIMQDSTLLNIDGVIENSMIGKNTEVVGTKTEGTSLFIGDHCKVSF